MDQKRILAAIMFSDIVGYSNLMSRDEVMAMRLLDKNREIHKSLISKYHGEFIKELGDGVLSTFNSSFDAVNCAIRIQKKSKKVPQLKIRIGIHIGDVIISEGDVFGDGVNIASRIEAVGEAGCIYISGRVNEDIQNKTDIRTEFVGIKSLKNISQSVNIYSVLQRSKKPVPSTREVITSTVVKENSIAVLPFINMSSDPDQEYFGEGMAEELINALTKIRNLNVVARTSSFAFKGHKIDIREIGHKLNVGMLVEGSIRKAGDQLRITVQLIKVEDGYHLWSERYDRKLEDIFAIQDEITEKIVDRLKTTLNLQVKSVYYQRPDNLAAYDNYLKGRFHINKFTPDDIETAIDHYKEAIKEDPGLSLSFTGLAEAYTLFSTGFDILPAKDTMPKAREAALMALELDPLLAEAYVSLGLVAMFYDYNKKLTLDYFQKALELNPNSSSANLWIEFYWSFMENDFEKGMTALQKAQELDPLNLLIKIRVGFNYIYKGDYAIAIDFFKKLVEEYPGFPMAHHSLMEAYGMKKMYNEALEEGEKMIVSGGKAVANIGGLGFHCAQAGHRKKALEILADLENQSKKGYVSSFWVGGIYKGLGEIDKAFEWFEKAYDDRDGNLIYITAPHVFGDFRTHPRYRSLLSKMGLENILPHY
jgi:TolB-like protein/class 3 adenylate cyclase/Tfp pilus assembly protein PilF